MTGLTFYLLYSCTTFEYLALLKLDSFTPVDTGVNEMVLKYH